MRLRPAPWCAALLIAAVGAAACHSPPEPGDSRPLEDRVEHHWADHDGVRIHYVTLGAGPLVVMLHGFPDFWWTWREQMEALAADFQVAALDLRGYNRSDRPPGVAAYAMPLLVGDVAAVIEDLGRERAVVVGHDWGGAIAWNMAMSRPELVERLIVCNLPHPRGLMRELAAGTEQYENSSYARDFQAPDAHEQLTPAGLAGWVREPAARERYLAAFERSDFEAMLNYYKANFPRADAQAAAAPPPLPPMPLVQAPVLMIHGLADQALLPAALNDTWEWLESDLTLVTIPGAGHFVQQDAAELVTRSMLAWLHR